MASDPRDDVYRVVTLLWDLDRALHPFPTPGQEDGPFGVEPNVPPALPSVPTPEQTARSFGARRTLREEATAGRTAAPPVGVVAFGGLRPPGLGGVRPPRRPTSGAGPAHVQGAGAPRVAGGQRGSEFGGLQRLSSLERGADMEGASVARTAVTPPPVAMPAVVASASVARAAVTPPPAAMPAVLARATYGLRPQWTARAVVTRVSALASASARNGRRPIARSPQEASAPSESHDMPSSESDERLFQAPRIASRVAQGLAPIGYETPASGALSPQRPAPSLSGATPVVREVASGAAPSFGKPIAAAGRPGLRRGQDGPRAPGVASARAFTHLRTPPAALRAGLPVTPSSVVLNSGSPPLPPSGPKHAVHTAHNVGGVAARGGSTHQDIPRASAASSLEDFSPFEPAVLEETPLAHPPKVLVRLGSRVVAVDAEDLTRANETIHRRFGDRAHFRIR